MSASRLGILGFGGCGKGEAIQCCNYWFTCIFIGDGAAHAGACCHICFALGVWLVERRNNKIQRFELEKFPFNDANDRDRDCGEESWYIYE